MSRATSQLVLLIGFLGVVFAAQWQCQGPASRPTEVQKPSDGEQLATFAGGCFWCMEPPFEALAGVRSVVSGYTGGKEKAPTYAQVSSGRTGHTEAVQVIFDPKTVSYATLVDTFWRSMDPTDARGQFADRGAQYRPGIFTHDAQQRQEAQRSKQALAKSKRFSKPIVVEITDYDAFYPAEAYHQDYYKTHSKHYKAYRRGSGREGFLRRVWGQPRPRHRALRPPVVARTPRPTTRRCAPS